MMSLLHQTESQSDCYSFTLEEMMDRAFEYAHVGDYLNRPDMDEIAVAYNKRINETMANLGGYVVRRDDVLFNNLDEPCNSPYSVGDFFRAIEEERAVKSLKWSSPEYESLVRDWERTIAESLGFLMARNIIIESDTPLVPSVKNILHIMPYDD